MKLSLLLLLGLIGSASCKTPTKIVKYPEQRNELYTTKPLQQLFLTNTSLKIVLRINELTVEKNSLAKYSNNQRKLVNNIEGLLIKKGFSVKDRTTFNDIISKSYSSDILKKELSDADLIFEIVEMNDKVVYHTDTIFSIGRNKSLAAIQPIDFRSMGAHLEFRLILVKSNEIGGIYKFNYQPCAHGCRLDEFSYSGKKNNRKVRLPESLNEEAFQQFVSTSLEELFHSFKEG